jgi:hypothetical protein
MACRISELVLGCRDPEVLARFWCEVLDFVVLDREDDGSQISLHARVLGMRFSITARRMSWASRPQARRRVAGPAPAWISPSRQAQTANLEISLSGVSPKVGNRYRSAVLR